METGAVRVPYSIRSVFLFSLLWILFTVSIMPFELQSQFFLLDEFCVANTYGYNRGETRRTCGLRRAHKIIPKQMKNERKLEKERKTIEWLILWEWDGRNPKEEKISCLEYVGMIFFEAIPCVSTCMVLVLYLLQTAYLSHAARAKVKGRVWRNTIDRHKKTTTFDTLHACAFIRNSSQDK